MTKEEINRFLGGEAYEFGLQRTSSQRTIMVFSMMIERKLGIYTNNYRKLHSMRLRHHHEDRMV